ncbi:MULTISPECIES: ABC transporter substrate-binding protein [unclassified Beijerinckia]|uniref:ABC transporter substrate-binding protein n=1 Tax=unclassified Beijerinckia TaxID=2638183 RepID=UPI001FCCC570|nr:MULTISPECIES: ABC transporter substrate-binding protein [unclassified Beijerinckia]
MAAVRFGLLGGFSMIGPRAAFLMLAASLICSVPLPSQAQEPTLIRFGRQTAAEDNLWLMIAKPELSPEINKSYKVQWTQFRASDMAFKAFEAGQADIITTNANAAITAATKGLDMKIIATLSRESNAAAKTYFLVRKDGPATIAEMKGKNIGIIGYRTGVELWARQALKTGGLNPDRDVTWSVVPFPAMIEAIRAGKITTGPLPEIFATNELRKDELRVLFTSKTGVPFDEDLIVVLVRNDFARANRKAIQAFAQDLIATSTYYDSHLKEARQALLDAKLVPLPPDVYLNMREYARDPKLLPNVEALNKQQDILFDASFIDQKLDVNGLIDRSYFDAATTDAR